LISNLVWSNGRFKTSKVISDPDKMRHIYYAPRLILYILRGPLIIVKLTLNAAGKAFFTPLRKMNKRMIKGKKPKSW
jgi:ariadne-1